MSPFLIFAISLTIAYAIYYAVMITRDLYGKKEEAKSNEEVFDISNITEEEAAVAINESDGGFSVADKQYDTSFQDGTSYDEGYGMGTENNGMPDDEARKKIILDLTSGFNCPFVEDGQKMKTVCDLTKKMSPSDISTIFNKLKVKGVINGSKAIEYEDLLVTIFEFEGKDEAQDKLIMFLNTNGVSQAKIVQKLNISARLVRNVLSKK